MRTFDRETYLRAQDAWRDGRYGWRWQGIRRIAAERGFIFPPEGNVHDDRDAENPSQRAIVYRALEDNPARLTGIVHRSRSWYDVVNGIIGLEARLAEEAVERIRDVAWERRAEPDHKESAASLSAILRRIGDSV